MSETTATERRIQVIVNPAAGGGRGEERFERLRPGVSAWRGEVSVYLTTARGDAERAAAAATAEGVDLIVAAGGDGTVHEIVNGMLAPGSAADHAIAPGRERRTPALSVLPLGTGCDFARNLGIGLEPCGSEPTRETTVDVGHVRCATDNGPADRYFVNAANMGASPAAAARVSRSALLRRAGAAAYVIAGLPEVLVRPQFAATCRVPGKATSTESLLNLTICNGARFGGGLALTPQARLTDGRLHMARVPRGGLLPVLRMLSAGYSTDDRPRGGVVTEVLQLVEIEGESVVEVDGEIPGRLPATFRVLAGRLRVLLPWQHRVAP